MGKIIYLFAKAINAKKVLELGTDEGYSTTFLGIAVLPDGSVDTIEIDRESAEISKENFKKLNLNKTVNVINANVMDILPKIRSNNYDMIYNDIDKEFYPKVLEDCIRILRPGGLLITDNLLWSGLIPSDGHSNPSFLKSIREYNKLICNHPKLISLILPIKDGTGISIKKGE
jgi:predicted O-methyltransferase YrrM